MQTHSDIQTDTQTDMPTQMYVLERLYVRIKCQHQHKLYQRPAEVKDSS